MDVAQNLDPYTRFWLPDADYLILATKSWLPDPGYQMRATMFCFQSS